MESTCGRAGVAAACGDRLRAPVHCSTYIIQDCEVLCTRLLCKSRVGCRISGRYVEVICWHLPSVTRGSIGFAMRLVVGAQHARSVYDGLGRSNDGTRNKRRDVEQLQLVMQNAIRCYMCVVMQRATGNSTSRTSFWSLRATKNWEQQYAENTMEPKPLSAWTGTASVHST